MGISSPTLHYPLNNSAQPLDSVLMQLKYQIFFILMVPVAIIHPWVRNVIVPTHSLTIQLLCEYVHLIKHKTRPLHSTPIT